MSYDAEAEADKREYSVALHRNSVVEILLGGVDTIPKEFAPCRRLIGFAPSGSKDSLIRAIEYQHYEDTLAQIQQGRRLNFFDERGLTPLMIAASHETPKIFNLLLEHGARPLFSPTYNQRDLSAGIAVIYDRVDTLKILLDYGISPNQRNNFKGTLLHFAAMSRSLHCMRLLLARGARVDLTTEKQTTPLMIATEMLDTNAAAYLLACGANVKKRNRYGADVVHLLTNAVDRAERAGLHLQNQDIARRCDALAFHMKLLFQIDPKLINHPHTTADDIDKAAAALRKLRKDIARDLTVGICIAMHGFSLPALLMLELVDESLRTPHEWSMHTKWSWIAKVKHFKD